MANMIAHVNKNMFVLVGGSHIEGIKKYLTEIEFAGEVVKVSNVKAILSSI